MNKPPSLPRLLLRAAAVLVVTAVSVAVSPPSAWAHVHGVPTSTSPPSASVFMHAVAVVATSVAAVATLGAIGRVRVRPGARPVLTVAAAPAALAGLLIPLPNAFSVVLAVLLVAGTLALPGAGGRPRGRRFLLASVWVLVAVQATLKDQGADRVLDAVVVLGATAGLSLVTAVVVAEAEYWPRARRRFMSWAALAGAVAAVAAALRGWIDGIRPDTTVWWWSFGRLTAAEVLLLAGVVALGLVLALAGRPAATLLRALAVAAGAIACASLVADAALAAVPQPPAPPAPGVPLLRTLTLGNYRLPVMVVPQQPGWNLVHLDASIGAAGTLRDRQTPATARPGATGSWARVWLPAGVSRLWVTYQGRTGSLPIDTGRSRSKNTQFAGPDGPECASAAFGALLAGSRDPVTACPAQSLQPAEARALTAMVRFVAARRVSDISVVADQSPRGRAALQLIRSTAAAYHLQITGPGWHPLFVVAGWTGALTALEQAGSSQIRTQGVYIAPWLLTAPLLSNYASPLIPLRFDTRTPAPMRYLNELDQRFPGEAASFDGYLSWLRSAPTGPLDLYAASLAYAPGDLPGHADHSPSWLPNGAVLPVTEALTPDRTVPPRPVSPPRETGRAAAAGEW